MVIIYVIVSWGIMEKIVSKVSIKNLFYFNFGFFREFEKKNSYFFSVYIKVREDEVRKWMFMFYYIVVL